MSDKKIKAIISEFDGLSNIYQNLADNTPRSVQENDFGAYSRAIIFARDICKKHLEQSE